MIYSIKILDYRFAESNTTIVEPIEQKEEMFDHRMFDDKQRLPRKKLLLDREETNKEIERREEATFELIMDETTRKVESFVPNNQIFTVQSAARYLNISEQKMYGYVKHGNVRSYKQGGRYRILKTDLIAFARRNVNMINAAKQKSENEYLFR